MAKQVSVIKFTGKLGNMVGFKGPKTDLIIREKAASVANPQTEEQMSQRAKFKLTSQLSGMLGDVGRIILKANGFKESERGELNKLIMPNVIIDDNSIAELNYKLNLIKHPVLPSSQIVASLSYGSNQYKLQVEALPVNCMAAKALLVYNTRTNQWDVVSSIDNNPNLTISVNPAEAASLRAYGYAVVIMPTTEKGRAILQNIQGPDRNYRLLARRMSSENFAFTRNTSCFVEGTSSSAPGSSDVITPSANVAPGVGPILKFSGEERPLNVVVTDGVHSVTIPDDGGEVTLPVDAFPGNAVELKISGWDPERFNLVQFGMEPTDTSDTYTYMVTEASDIVYAEFAAID